MVRQTPERVASSGRRMMAEIHTDLERNGSPADAVEGAARMAIIMARYPHEVWLTHLLYTNHILINAMKGVGGDLGPAIVQVETRESMAAQQQEA